MGEASRRKKREDEIARTPIHGLHVTGLTLLGGFVEDADDVEVVREEVRDILSAPSALRSEEESQAALARFEASPIDELGIFHLWTLAGETMPLSYEAYEATGLEGLGNLPQVHVGKTGRPQALSCTPLNGGPAIDPKAIHGTIRVDADGVPVASCDIPLALQAEVLVSETLERMVEDSIDDMVAGPAGKDLRADASFESHKALVHALARASIGEIAHDDAWIDATTAMRMLEAPPQVTDMTDREPGVTAKVTRELRRKVSGSAIRDLGRLVGAHPDEWYRIDDEGAGLAWHIATSAIEASKVGLPTPGAGALMLHYRNGMRMFPPARARLLASATVLGKSNGTEAFSLPDGRLLALATFYDDLYVIAWDPTAGPTTIGDRFDTQRFAGYDWEDLPETDMAFHEEFEHLDLAEFMPGATELADFPSVALMKAHAEGATLPDFLASLASCVERRDRPTPPPDLPEQDLAFLRRRIEEREVAARTLAAYGSTGKVRNDLVTLFGYLGDALDDYEDEILDLDSAMEWPQLPDLLREGRLILDAHLAGATLLHLASAWADEEGLTRIFDWTNPKHDDRPDTSA